MLLLTNLCSKERFLFRLGNSDMDTKAIAELILEGDPSGVTKLVKLRTSGDFSNYEDVLRQVKFDKTTENKPFWA
jgi:hypothetical protein